MSERYDAIVIGAGLGGLSAAARLASEGLGVLLLERHNVPGGYATSFVRGRYEFEVALHELSGIGPPEKRGSSYEYLDRIGVADKVKFVRIPEMYRAVFPEVDLVMPVGREAYEATLCEAFPHAADGIRSFIEVVFRLGREIQTLEKAGGPGNYWTLAFRYPTLGRHVMASWGSVLRRYVKDPGARAVLSQLWGYFGSGPEKAPFTYFAAALSSYMKVGPTHIKGRSQALSNAFVAAIEEAGGRVLFNAGVREITTSNGKVTGVSTEDGRSFESDWIVSNASPVTTCRDLLAGNRAAAKFLGGLKCATPSSSSVNVYLGVARSPEELGLGVHENFVNADYDQESHYERMKTLEEPGVTLVTCYNTVLPEVSPPGTSMMVLTTLQMGEHWLELKPEEYVATKNRIADAMLRQAEKIAPGLREYAEVLEVGTPLTNIRYTGNPDGAIYGFANTPDYHTALRMGPRGPIAGLYFAGAWSQPGGGFQPSMESGHSAANRVLHRAGKLKREA